ncbi:MAG TPA: class II aldolase/adducin family protein [Bacteroidetes bacterium]|nr:class II aldolase/adducin family protein [Bacteroidota bacterium]
MNSEKEGYIRFHCHWRPSGPLIPAGMVLEINRWRSVLYSMEMLGCLEDGTGFGNISLRAPTAGKFFITGTATGKFKKLHAGHFSLVEKYGIDRNEIVCTGPVRASSESLSHAAVYETLSRVNAVVHIHHAGLWKQWKNRVPTTHETAEYGTPEMAREIIRLLRESKNAEKRMVVMGGHPEGIIIFGKDLEEAMASLLAYINTAEP